MRDWDDLRFFLGVARHGSTLSAAAALKASQSTVFRRIAGLEAALGVKLFDRSGVGYALTAAGAALLPHATAAESAIEVFNQAAAVEVRREISVIRFSAPDAAIEYLLQPVMVAFAERYPDVKLEIFASPRQLDLSTGEADVALRANPASDPALFGRRLVEEQPVLAGSGDYVGRLGLPANEMELADHHLIALTGVLGDRLGPWFEAVAPPSHVILKPDSIASTLAAVRAGVGLGVLPQFIVDREPSLIAAPLRLPIEPFELWVVTHERLRGSPPVKALMEVVANYVLSTTPSPSRAA